MVRWQLQCVGNGSIGRANASGRLKRRPNMSENSLVQIRYGAVAFDRIKEGMEDI